MKPSQVASPTNPCFINPSACPVVTTFNQLVTAGRPEFQDLTGYERAVSAIETIAAQGVLQGIDSNHFAPGEPVSRSVFATAFSRIFSFPASSASILFSDIQKDDLNRIAYERAQPYMSAYVGESGAINFFPASQVTREDAALSAVGLLLAGNKLTLVEPAESDAILRSLDDNNGLSAKKIRSYIATALAHHLLQTDDEGEFDRAFGGHWFLNRADFAVLLISMETLFGPPPRNATSKHESK